MQKKKTICLANCELCVHWNSVLADVNQCCMLITDASSWIVIYGVLFLGIVFYCCQKIPTCICILHAQTKFLHQYDKTEKPARTFLFYAGATPICPCVKTICGCKITYTDVKVLFYWGCTSRSTNKLKLQPFPQVFHLYWSTNRQLTSASSQSRVWPLTSKYKYYTKHLKLIFPSCLILSSCCQKLGIVSVFILFCETCCQYCDHTVWTVKKRDWGKSICFFLISSPNL